jgi:hypothetical protein
MDLSKCVHCFDPNSDLAMNTTTSNDPGVLVFLLAAWESVRDALLRLFTPAVMTFLILVALEVVADWMVPGTIYTGPPSTKVHLMR